MSTLTEEQQKVWDKLNYVPRQSWWSDLDVNGLYPYQADVIMNISRGVEPVKKKGGLGVDLTVIKNRHKPNS